MHCRQYNMDLEREQAMHMARKRDRAVAKKKAAAPTPASGCLLPGEEPDIRKEVASVIADAASWLEQPNDQLGGQRPKHLIDTVAEQQLRDLVRAIKHGMPT
jgi:hypothetical protein